MSAQATQSLAIAVRCNRSQRRQSNTVDWTAMLEEIKIPQLMLVLWSSTHKGFFSTTHRYFEGWTNDRRDGKKIARDHQSKSAFRCEATRKSVIHWLWTEFRAFSSFLFIFPFEADFLLSPSSKQKRNSFWTILTGDACLWVRAHKRNSMDFVFTETFIADGLNQNEKIKKYSRRNVGEPAWVLLSHFLD